MATRTIGKRCCGGGGAGQQDSSEHVGCFFVFDVFSGGDTGDRTSPKGFCLHHRCTRAGAAVLSPFHPFASVFRRRHSSDVRTRQIAVKWASHFATPHPIKQECRLATRGPSLASAATREFELTVAVGGSSTAVLPQRKASQLCICRCLCRHGLPRRCRAWLYTGPQFHGESEPLRIPVDWG